MTHKDQLRTAIQTRDADTFKHLLRDSLFTDYTSTLYELVKEEPTREVLTFVHANNWTQNILHSFGVMELYSFLTNRDFQPTILDCYSKQNYSIQEMLINVEVDEEMIPERFEEIFYKFKNILNSGTKDNFLEKINHESHPEDLAMPFLQWALEIHEPYFLTEQSYFRLLDRVYKVDPNTAFEIISKSKAIPTLRQKRQLVNKEIIQLIEKRDLNIKLSQSLQARNAFSVSKI